MNSRSFYRFSGQSGYALLEGAIATTIALPLLLAALSYSYSLYARGVVEDLVSRHLHEVSSKLLEVKKSNGVYYVGRSSTFSSDLHSIRAINLSNHLMEKLAIDDSRVFVEACSYEISINPQNGTFVGEVSKTCGVSGSLSSADLQSLNIVDSGLISATKASEAAIVSSTGFLPVGIILGTRVKAHIFPAWITDLGSYAIAPHVITISYSRPYAEINL